MTLLNLIIISACHLLGDYMEAVKQDPEKAFRIYDTNCVAYKHGHSCHKVGSAKMRGKGTIRSMVSYLLLQSTNEYKDMSQILST